jgi:hypothetical protein
LETDYFRVVPVEETQSLSMLCALLGARTLLSIDSGAGFLSGLPVDAKIEKGVAPFLCQLRNVAFAKK